MEIILFLSESVCYMYSLKYCIQDRKDFPKFSLFAFWPGVMINPQWLEQISMVPNMLEPLRFDIAVYEDIIKPSLRFSFFYFFFVSKVTI